MPLKCSQHRSNDGDNDGDGNDNDDSNHVAAAATGSYCIDDDDDPSSASPLSTSSSSAFVYLTLPFHHYSDSVRQHGTIATLWPTRNECKTSLFNYIKTILSHFEKFLSSFPTNPVLLFLYFILLQVFVLFCLVSFSSFHLHTFLSIFDFTAMMINFFQHKPFHNEKNEK